MFRLTDPLLPAIADEFGTTVGSVALIAAVLYALVATRTRRH